MRVAIIDDNVGLLEIYRDEFSDYDIKLFNDPTKFLQLDHGLYDIVIISHRFGNESWKKFSREFKNNPKIIVTSTYPRNHYVKEFPNLAKDLDEKSIVSPRIKHFEKEDYKTMQKALYLEEMRLTTLCLLTV